VEQGSPGSRGFDGKKKKKKLKGSIEGGAKAHMGRGKKKETKSSSGDPRRDWGGHEDYCLTDEKNRGGGPVRRGTSGKGLRGKKTCRGSGASTCSPGGVFEEEEKGEKETGTMKEQFLQKS